MPKIVTFGSSGCIPGSTLYDTAYQLGKHLAHEGFDVVSGGYSGTMEAVSKGAMEVGNVKVEGVIVPKLFPNRPPRGNEYLNVVTTAESLMHRLTILIESSDVC
jgi:uncharacterized protein (TIGR00725 family)